jgi:hypothetical protein
MKKTPTLIGFSVEAPGIEDGTGGGADAIVH